jgi:hypothetical protein
MVIGYAKIVGTFDELRCHLESLLVALNREIQSALAVVHCAEEMIGKNVVWVGLYESFELSPSIAILAFHFLTHGVKEAVIDVGITQEHPAFGTVFV